MTSQTNSNSSKMVSSVSFSKSEKQRHGVLYTLEAACNKILNESGENGLSSQSSQRLLGRKLAEFEAELKRCQNAVGIRVSKLSGDKREQALSSWEELSSPWESWLTNSFILLEILRRIKKKREQNPTMCMLIVQQQ